MMGGARSIRLSIVFFTRKNQEKGQSKEENVFRAIIWVRKRSHLSPLYVVGRNYKVNEKCFGWSLLAEENLRAAKSVGM